MNFGAMLAKELKELVRSYKLFFVPIVFALMGVTQPITMKMLPQLMKTATNLPKGAVISIPTPPPGDVLASVLSNFAQIPLIVLILTVMGAIAAERASGVAATVLTKPVGRGGYITAKAVAYSLLAVVSLVVGYGIAAYYTQVLIGPVDWLHVLQSGALYLPNLLLAVAATLCFSAFLPTQLAAAGGGLVTIVILNLVPKYMGDFISSVYPGALSASAAAAATGQSYTVGRPVIGVLVLVIAFFVGGWVALERQEI